MKTKNNNIATWNLTEDAHTIWFEESKTIDIIHHSQRLNSLMDKCERDLSEEIQALLGWGVWVPRVVVADGPGWLGQREWLGAAGSFCCCCWWWCCWFERVGYWLHDNDKQPKQHGHHVRIFHWREYCEYGKYVLFVRGLSGEGCLIDRHLTLDCVCLC